MSSSLPWTSRSTSNHERAFLVANANNVPGPDLSHKRIRRRVLCIDISGYLLPNEA
jgi:hypothetical protein